MTQKISIFWFRRDLRLDDNHAFYKALQSKYPVLPIFIFDPTLLDRLPKNDVRVSFIFNSVQKLRSKIKNNSSSALALYHNTPKEVFAKLTTQFDIQEVYTNHDYEPYALKRDEEIKLFLAKKNSTLLTYKDQVIFEKDEIVKNNGTPYVVFTPYKRKWKETFQKSMITPFYTENYAKKLFEFPDLPDVSLEEMGFIPASIKVSGFDTSPELINNYESTRNFPAIKNGTSRLGPHLRFGTVSIRKIVAQAIAQDNEVFLSELIWREFFMQILWHFPHTHTRAFKPKYDRIEWRNNEEDFEKWKNGITGYPIVDAGMRELNATGYMHNRVRMIVASFLCKHLLIDWRWGESYFASKLLDYDMSANVGNWQWASGSGVDAAPYFRIFNPTTQITKFDKQLEYINKWVPDLNEFSYPQPMVDHKMARERCLNTYKAVLN